MKLKKLIYIILILALLPVFAAAEEYPYLPTMLKEKVISVFGINTAGKTMLYERVNIYGDLDAWMIGWFDSNQKIVTGITDSEDIIYYSISQFEGVSAPSGTAEISTTEGETKARSFLNLIMPNAEFKLVAANAYEYTFSQCHNGIRILGREATVVVDKQNGNVSYYKGFGQTDSSFELMERLISPEHAFEIYYENIGLELVYNTVFDDRARIKTVRPMYILNRSNFEVIDAQTGEISDVVMYDYNYYYNDSYYDKKYYYDNNIHTEEKRFRADGSVSASGYDVSELFNLPQLNLSEGYSSKITPGRLEYYSDAVGNLNSCPALQIDIVPLKHSVSVLKFAEMFEDGNTEWLSTVNCDTPLIFARAYVEADTGRLLDYETVENNGYNSENGNFDKAEVDSFIADVAGDLLLKHYGTYQTDSLKHHLSYARYIDGVRVIGEGASVVYDSRLGAVTDYSLIITDSEFLPVPFMKTPQQIKQAVKNELSLELFYVDKDENTKYVIYDATDKNIAFDPVTGVRTDRLKGDDISVIASCGVGSDNYMLNGISHTAPPPVISSDRLFLPIELICESIGYDMQVIDGNITLSREGNMINFSEKDNTSIVNGTQITLDLPPVNISGDMYVSVQSVRNIFGIFVRWDPDTNLIHMIK